MALPWGRRTDKLPALRFMRHSVRGIALVALVPLAQLGVARTAVTVCAVELESPASMAPLSSSSPRRGGRPPLFPAMHPVHRGLWTRSTVSAPARPRAQWWTEPTVERCVAVTPALTQPHRQPCAFCTLAPALSQNQSAIHPSSKAFVLSSVFFCSIPCSLRLILF